MDIQKLNNKLIELITKKKELCGMSYSDASYDALEEQLHDLEDRFLSDYGVYLEEVLHEVHDEYCPDNEVLLPIAYFPSQFELLPNGEFKVGCDQGVYVDVDDYDASETKLVLVPNPIRLVLNVGKTQQEIVWQA
ncbi:hypothetical protein [Fulvivirga lutea]|uniref:Uncharacterized protein n=1 Tax=Fulvivirga lutea TaxID=2810512 RepID=A0A975A0F9_9BACT|nr:hypothetical protein [Fulvivirga lutea]QSE96776.1 hypothetical protein JR347_14405 [Fulvivirga lutea]